MNKFSNIYVGLDVHKATIAVAVARAGRSDPQYYGEIRNNPGVVRKLLKQLSSDGEVLNFCYEAGPCGYGLVSGHFRPLFSSNQITLCCIAINSL